MNPTAENVKARQATALVMAESGFCIIPLHANSKRPIPADWRNVATKDQAIINQWFHEHPDCNYGYVPDGTYFIVDTDQKNGKDGESQLDLLEVMHGPLPRTLIIKTASGGKHRIFKSPVLVRTSVEKIAPGIDIIGTTQCVGPGSVVDGKEYVIIDDVDIAEAPQWLIDLARAGDDEERDPSPSRGDPVTDEVAEEVAAHLDPNVSYEEWRNNVAGLAAANIVGDDGRRTRARDIAHKYSRGDYRPLTRLKYEAGPVDLVIETMPPKEGGVGFGTVVATARAKGNYTGNPHDNGSTPAETFKDADLKIDDAPSLAPDDRPIVPLIEGALPQVIDAAEDALIAQKSNIYQFGSLLVQPGLTQYKDAEGHDVTSLRLVEMKRPAMIEAFTSAVTFQRFDKRSDDWVNKDCPAIVADAYLSRPKWNVHELTGIVYAPTLRADGTILDQPGYDDATGLLYEPGQTKFLPVPKNPTKDDALAALGFLKSLIASFPYKNDASRSVALSGILTTLIRRSLANAPLHAFSAPVAGSGKSFQVDLAALLATGEPAPVIAQAGEEETEKRIATQLIAGAALICMDNCSKPVEGDLLNQVLTQAKVRPRILGQSKHADVVANAMMFATGNALIVSGDMTRRTILGVLDPQCERPELRHFDTDPAKVLLADRPKYVQAALTVLRAYFVAGRPEMTTPMGSFEAWSRTVRDALVWLGEADPCDTMEAVRAYDPVRDALGNLLYSWRGVFGTTRIGVTELLNNAGGLDDDLKRVEYKAMLREALLAVAGKSHGGRDVIDARSLGRYLVKNSGRVVGALSFVEAGKVHKKPVYSLQSDPNSLADVLD